MKSLVGLLLALSIALPACSAENDPAATTPPAVEDTTSTTPAPRNAEAATADSTPVVAQATAPATTPVAEARETSTPPVVKAPAPRSDIVAGKHYRVLTPAQPTSSSPDKVELAEVFMYSCPHCMDFEPFIENYLKSKPGYVSFVRIPANFNRTALLHSKAYYMAETLGILDEVHMDLFHEYHRKRNRLATEEAIISFFVDQGVPRDQVTGAYNSFAVDTKVRQAGNLGQRYRIDSVPTVVINGKYVTSASMAGSFNKLGEIIDYLTAKEASEL